MEILNETEAFTLEEIAGHDILLRVDTGGLRATEWIARNAAEIDRLLQREGALLVRGLKIMSSKEFGQALTGFFGEELINYTYRSTPRTELRGNVYTATEYHPGETIPQHNENAYSNLWPLRIGFLCLLPSPTGGATPIADSREVYKRIPAPIREKFEAKGVMYVRNYGDIDLPWTEVFQTTEKADVEAFCRLNGMSYEWFPDGGLRTRQVNQAALKHPVTGEMVWFNQAHLFHISALPDEVRSSLLAAVSEDRVPRNACYGDGTPLEVETLDVIRDIYDELKYSFAWQKDDLMLLDNMLYTHGRQPFQGERKVLVGMARPVNADGLVAAGH
jgi:alpha-ketoglutarate-dependent taurine dioxygenase